MKKLAMVILMLAPTFSFADFPSIKVSNFTVDYNDPKGTGSAQEFEFPNEYVTVRKKLFNIIISKENDQFIFTYDANEYALENPPAILLDAQNFSWSNLNLNSFKNKINLTVAGFDYKSNDKLNSVSNLNLDCIENGDEQEDLAKKLLSSCLTQSKIKIAKVSIQTNEILNLLVANVIETKVSPSSTTLKKLLLEIVQHNFNLKLSLKSDITITIKAKGKTWYLQDENKIKVQLNHAKAGFFSVKEKIFSELENDTSGKVTVQRPFIYIDLNQ